MIGRIMGLFFAFAVVLNGYFFYLSKSIIGILIGSALSLSAGGILYILIIPIKQILEDSEKILNTNIHKKISSKHEKGALSPIVQALKRLQKNNMALVGKILTASDKIYSYSNDIQIYSEETEKGSKDINQSIFHITEQMERQAIDAGKTKEDISVIFKDIQEMAEFANTSKEEAKNMQHVITESVAIFEKITERLQEGSHASRSLAQEIKELENQANRIVDIVNVVTNISKQTGLLALNAAIEAARAGEEGKGFAVVANEVKKLATESTTSIEGIKALIESIIRQIEVIVGKMNHELSIVDGNIQLSAQAKKKFFDIQGATETTTKAIDHILALTQKEVEKIRGVDNFMGAVANAATACSATAEETTTASQHQAKAMEEIYESIEKFGNMARELKTIIMSYAQEFHLDEDDQNHIENVKNLLQGIAKEHKLEELTNGKLKEVKEKNTYLELLAVTGIDGLIKAATFELNSTIRDVGHREFYLDAIKGNIYVSKPYISSLTDDYCVTIAMPIKETSGRICGTLIGDVTL
ncbi:methyl-accepting chemotaxis protein [Anaerosolibacter carboniphilus]|uniref:Methyl-accepting chemotaxis protein n=1 Tax=Anaerosolibacter carboniphilus TaxID=1417629 RepID=A0A841KYQ5_9FIRM|nr:methyl-accepting chemotaxis protein [Anaerosolibacter carboniphilus]MBB6218487.1 methyl-accepting chemotaxis protein [Anaerosolibacter carboniphilus]